MRIARCRRERQDHGVGGDMEGILRDPGQPSRHDQAASPRRSRPRERRRRSATAGVNENKAANSRTAVPICSPVLPVTPARGVPPVRGAPPFWSAEGADISSIEPPGRDGSKRPPPPSHPILRDPAWRQVRNADHRASAIRADIHANHPETIDATSAARPITDYWLSVKAARARCVEIKAAHTKTTSGRYGTTRPDRRAAP